MPRDDPAGRLPNWRETLPLAHAAPRCGAKTRNGGACCRPALHGKKRCRLHGGASTGPRTPEGLERSRQAKVRHGQYTKEALGFRRQLAELRRKARELMAACDAEPNR